MRLAFVNVMQELQKFDSTAYITQPPVPLAVLNSATPAGIETALMDEQTERIRYTGDAFAFSVSTQNSAAVYDHADALRAAGKQVLLGGIHVTVCPDEALQHADAIVTGEAEGVWPQVCADLLAGTLKGRYDGSPTPSERMSPVDYSFFGSRRYLTPASLFATRGCNRRCSFCVSSNHMGPYRTKPLDVLEQEIDQLSSLYPGIFLQFTDDNLLADKNYRDELLPLLRRKGVKFITMVTVDQYCDASLIEEMAASGCIGVAVGVESVDDDNCASMNKYQNLSQPFCDAVRHANSSGIQTAALIMLGLPHDTPARLEHTLRELQHVPCSLYDIRILRIYPSTSLYKEMLATGEVTENWWLQKEPHGDCNHLLPSCLSVHFRHRNFGAMELQRMALRYTSELNRMNRASIAEITRIGSRGGGLKLAATVLYARRRAAAQARRLQQQVENAMTAQKA